MILVYELLTPRDGCLSVQMYGMEIDMGKPMRGTRYPGQAERLLKSGLPGLSLKSIDRKILMNLMMQDSGREAQVRVKGRDAYRLMELLCETGRAYSWANPNVPLKRAASPLAAKAVWETKPLEIRTALELPPGLFLLPARPPMALNPESGLCHALDSGNDETVSWAWISTPPMPPDGALPFYQSMISRHPSALLPPPPSMDEQNLENYTPVPRLRVRSRNASGELSLFVELHFRYGELELPADDEFRLIRFFENGKVLIAERNREMETACMERLRAIGLRPSRYRSRDLFAAAREKRAWEVSEEVTWTRLVGETFPLLEAEGWEVAYEGSARPVLPVEEDWYAEFTESKRGWMSYEQGVRAGEKRVNLLPALHAFLRERAREPLEEIRAYLETRDVPVQGEDCIVMIEGRRFLRMVEQLFELFGAGSLDTQNRLRLNPWRAAEIAVDNETVWRPPPELLHAVRTLRGALSVEPMLPPEGFLAELRPYQQQGLGWLNFLQETRMGGVLADDMGLGKTVQVLALLAHRKAVNPDTAPVLIVSPSSVLPNWRRESKKFAPNLRVTVMHGSDRHENPGRVERADILLTTYSLFWRDQAFYEQLHFSCLILDEAQAVKNPKARAHQTACKIAADIKICLTGTPCENHLGDLWALFNIVQPGFLGSESDFRSVYRRPIEEDRCPVLRRSLQNRIRPLLLRRTKELVATELPPKTEIIVTVPLSEAQTDQYQTVRLAMSEKIQEEMARKGLAQSRIIVLDAMLKLRQSCCDPRLRDPDRRFKIPEDSAKLAHLMEMVPELLEEGRRILLFSQFTSMLDLIKPELKKRKIPFVEIRGDTRDRDTPVQRFQAGEVPLFLISLKAGGSGLNLTAADTVIHYDPWWNPAVEAQATDRAHRIGQDKPVFVYKLVTENTIENAILEMQNEKRDLAGLLESGDGRSLSFSETDLQRLLAPLPMSD